MWDYINHRQYEIKHEHLDRLIAISGGDELGATEVDSEIRNSGILDEFEPDLWGWDCLSRIFHLGTQIGRNDKCDAKNVNPYRGYVDYCESIANSVPEMFPTRSGESLALPPPKLDDLKTISLKCALWQRSTCRSFHGEKVGLATLSDALYATFGAVHGDDRQDLEKLGLLPVGYRRTSPSGGSLHPSEPYLVALQVEGLEPGIYHYRADAHELVRVREGLHRGELGELLCAQNFAEDLSYGVFIVSVFSKMWWKYPHSRAYRVALLDVGCLTQTFQLVCTAQNVQSWPTGYLNDHKVNALLGLDGVTSSVVFFLGAGYGSGSVAPEALQVIREKRDKEEHK
ncbi:SagB family peptide dehydrogenase [Robbsia sp. KACC 23696]|uniref:SagB family peptide dehydrogenase n=1 Tax=Robbsia sp. KACC 23696 TaxID=3149231 RepID=UPI00325A8FB3